jgi:hypothetical protein
MLNRKLIISTLAFVLFVNFGCGAKDAIVLKPVEHKEIVKLGEDEAISVMLGKYDHYDVYSTAKTAKRRARVENKLEHCIYKAAKKNKPPVRVIPTGIIKEYIAQNYNYTNFAEATSPKILKTLQNPITSEDIKTTGLRYLVVIDVATDKNYSDVEFYGDIESSEGMALGIMGLAKDGIKKTSASLHIIDVRRRLEAGQITLSSSGSDGWTAGIVLFVIIPIPYYFPWWSLTEAEICDALGEQVVDIVTSQGLVPQKVSQSVER